MRKIVLWMPKASKPSSNQLVYLWMAEWVHQSMNGEAKAAMISRGRMNEWPGGDGKGEGRGEEKREPCENKGFCHKVRRGIYWLCGLFTGKIGKLFSTLLSSRGRLNELPAVMVGGMEPHILAGMLLALCEKQLEHLSTGLFHFDDKRKGSPFRGNSILARMKESCIYFY